MGLFGAISREATYITSIGRSLASLRHVTPDSYVVLFELLTLVIDRLDASPRSASRSDARRRLLSALANIAFLPAYPIWAVIVIALDVLAIYALAVHGREVQY